MRTITIYSTHACGCCRNLKAFLDEQGIAYENNFVDGEKEKLREMLALCNSQTVPVIVFDKGLPTQEIQVGFEQADVKKALGLL